MLLGGLRQQNDWGRSTGVISRRLNAPTSPTRNSLLYDTRQNHALVSSAMHLNHHVPGSRWGCWDPRPRSPGSRAGWRRAQLPEHRAASHAVPSPWPPAGGAGPIGDHQLHENILKDLHAHRKAHSTYQGRGVAWTAASAGRHCRRRIEFRIPQESSCTNRHKSSARAIMGDARGGRQMW